MKLPVDAALPELIEGLRRSGAAVLVAPPGSGKTTRVPPALLDAGLAGDGKVLVLQPRRVAARLAATRIAEERGCSLGGEVGYSVRFERRTSADTRIELLTEGLLLRRLQSDPFLEEAGCVVLDEFHERSLHVDMALALLQEVRREVRPELRLVVMSATLDPGPVAAYLGDCPVVRAQGRVFPVDLSYDPEPDERRLERRVARAVREGGGEGHTLVFLPGVREIQAAQGALSSLEQEVLPLHGRMRMAEQARALRPGGPSRVVLATNIAETSITLPGVRRVVDSGLARVPRFDVAVGLSRLELQRVSLASAEQRAGRAGRTGPGACRRLWTEHEQRRLSPYELPEVQREDLTPAVLQLRVWGVNPAEFSWFEAPSSAAIERAERLLLRLGALDALGAVTTLGQRLARMPLHPRLAAVVVEGQQQGCLDDAATLAALASERDPLRGEPGATHWDLLERVRAVQRGRGHPGALKQLKRVKQQLMRVAGQPRGGGRRASQRTLSQVMLAGFPDRVGVRRSSGDPRLRMADGQGAVLQHPQQVGDSALVMALDLSAGRRGERQEHRVHVASALELDWLPTREHPVLRFDEQRRAVVATLERRYLDLVLSERPDHSGADPAQVSALLAQAARGREQEAFNFTPALEQWLARLRCLADWAPGLQLPEFRDLGPLLDELCHGRRSFAQLAKVNLGEQLRGRLTWAQKEALRQQAPERFKLPTGKSAKLTYCEGKHPVLAARIQQLFGLADTPRVAKGRVPVVLHLLAPNNRPAQVTSDLAGFWAGSYAQVRKDLRGRYPKHSWPEDPANARPEDRPRRRRG